MLFPLEGLGSMWLPPSLSSAFNHQAGDNGSQAQNSSTEDAGGVGEGGGMAGAGLALLLIRN